MQGRVPGAPAGSVWSLTDAQLHSETSTRAVVVLGPVVAIRYASGRGKSPRGASCGCIPWIQEAYCVAWAGRAPWEQAARIAGRGSQHVWPAARAVISPAKAWVTRRKRKRALGGSDTEERLGQQRPAASPTRCLAIAVSRLGDAQSAAAPLEESPPCTGLRNPDIGQQSGCGLRAARCWCSSP
jgi:hypothetical protein